MILGVRFGRLRYRLSVKREPRSDADTAERVDADAMTLADHIEATHQPSLREELPRLNFMTEKVSRVHGDKDHRLSRMRDAFVAFKAELEPHMLKEERILPPPHSPDRSVGPAARRSSRPF